MIIEDAYAMLFDDVKLMKMAIFALKHQSLLGFCLFALAFLHLPTHGMVFKMTIQCFLVGRIVINDGTY